MNFDPGMTVQHLALCPGARVRADRSGQDAFADGSASDAAPGQLRALSHLGNVVPGGAAGVHGHRFSAGPVDEAQFFAPVLWAGLGFNLLLLATFKYVPGIAVSIPVGFAAEVLAPGLAAGHLVLDVSGDELSLRPLPRRRDGSLAAGICAVHGVLPGGDFGTDLPHARHVAAIPLPGSALAQ